MALLCVGGATGATVMRPGGGPSFAAAPTLPGASAAPAGGQTSAAPAPPPAPTTAAPPPAPPQPTVPPTTPTATATPPQPTQPPKPEPQLPAVAQFTISGNALDNSYSVDKDGNLVGTYPANHSQAQMWRLDKFSDGRYFLRNGSTNFTKVLDLDLASGRIQVWTNPPGDENQLWSFVQVRGGYQIVNSYTKQCLTSDGSAQWARVQACSTADNQVWTVS